VAGGEPAAEVGAPAAVAETESAPNAERSAFAQPSVRREHARKIGQPFAGIASAAPAPRGDDLGEEVASLYEIKRSIDVHDPARALELLDGHRQRFSRGRLKMEADVLRVQALLNTGDRLAAAALGRALVDSSPNGPLAARVRSLLSSYDLWIEQGGEDQ
jgi:hypothetical protein